MPIAERSATTAWDGDLAHGGGVVTGASGGLGDLPVTWASRTERSDGKTSPEELIAAAHASCFSMALAHELTQAGTPPEHLDVNAKVTLDQKDGAPTVTTSELTVTGRVPGIDQAAFEQAASGAGKNCPISRALASLEITVSATLADASTQTRSGRRRAADPAGSLAARLRRLGRDRTSQRPEDHESPEDQHPEPGPQVDVDPGCLGLDVM